MSVVDGQSRRQGSHLRGMSQLKDSLLCCDGVRIDVVQRGDVLCLYPETHSLMNMIYVLITHNWHLLPAQTEGRVEQCRVHEAVTKHLVDSSKQLD